MTRGNAGHVHGPRVGVPSGSAAGSLVHRYMDHCRPLVVPHVKPLPRPTHLSESRERDEKDEQLVELIVALARNVLQVADPPGKTTHDNLVRYGRAWRWHEGMGLLLTDGNLCT